MAFYPVLMTAMEKFGAQCYVNIALCSKLPGLTFSGESAAVKKLVGLATAVTACGFIDLVSRSEEAPPVVLFGSPHFLQVCEQSKLVLRHGPTWRHPNIPEIVGACPAWSYCLGVHTSCRFANKASLSSGTVPHGGIPISLKS